MRKFVLFAIIIALLVSMAATVQAAPPPEGPLGLKRAIVVQEEHNRELLALPGVTGTAVGFVEGETAAIKIFTEKTDVAGIPSQLEGVPVIMQVTGKLIALKGPPSDKGKGNGKGAPNVTIVSPVDGSHFESSPASITLIGTAHDKEEGDISGELEWYGNGYSLGTGASVSVILADDTYIIEAKVTDLDGNTGSDSVLITVGEPTLTGLWPRPVPIGVSTGNAKECSAGTIGARVKDTKGNVYALSNNHVYARMNKARNGEIITQPGLYDTECEYCTSSYLGELSAFTKIKFIKGMAAWINYVDAAVALTSADNLDKATPLDGYGTPNNEIIGDAEVALDMFVQKYGQTTGLTHGTVSAINWAGFVWYDSSVAYFEKQIIITGSGFSGRGDSGSLIVTDDNYCKPVGLLFAGNETGDLTIANPISSVLSTFGVTIDGENK